jgi:hypothetical protein
MFNVSGPSRLAVFVFQVWPNSRADADRPRYQFHQVVLFGHGRVPQMLTTPRFLQRTHSTLIVELKP